MMARSLAGDLIQRLHERGMSNAQIGKALGGYDSAIIGRVASGKRPGTNLVGPLSALAGGSEKASVPKAEHQKRTYRDEGGRVISYSSKNPSANRLNTLLRQAEKGGATRVGIVADVGQFQGYEHRAAGQHLVRAFRQGDTPAAMRSRLASSGGSGEQFLLRDIQNATGAERVADLRGVTINIYYG